LNDISVNVDALAGFNAVVQITHLGVSVVLGEEARKNGDAKMGTDHVSAGMLTVPPTFRSDGNLGTHY
jgi:hypothetical protein